MRATAHSWVARWPAISAIRWRTAGSWIAGPAGALHLLRQRDERVERHARAGGIADQHALVLERRSRDLPALAAFAHDVLRRHANVVEEHLAEVVAALHHDERPHVDPGSLHRDEQVGDARVLGRVGLGAEQAEHHVGLGGVAGPDLLPVDHPLVADELGAPTCSEARSLPAPGSL
jgi:hypothetical protein